MSAKASWLYHLGLLSRYQSTGSAKEKAFRLLINYWYSFPFVPDTPLAHHRLPLFVCTTLPTPSVFIHFVAVLLLRRHFRFGLATRTYWVVFVPSSPFPVDSSLILDLQNILWLHVADQSTAADILYYCTMQYGPAAKYCCYLTGPKYAQNVRCGH